MFSSGEPKWKAPATVLVILCLVRKAKHLVSSVLDTDGRLFLKAVHFSSTHLCPPASSYFFSLFEYHMEHSFPTLSKNRQKLCLDSCTAATAVIDKDLAVFILKFWIKQTAINLPVCLLQRPVAQKTLS